MRMLLGAMIFCLVAGHPAAEPLTVLGEEAPFLYYRSPEGAWQGLAWDLVQQIGKRTGQALNVSSVVWTIGYNMSLDQPNIVLFSMVKTKAREPLFQWIGPFVDIQFGLFARKDSSVKVSTLEDARRLPRIGVYTDDISDLWFSARGFTNLDRAKSASSNVKKLLAGFLPVIASSYNRVATELKEAGDLPDSIKMLYPYLNAPLYFAFSRGSDPALVASWAHAFQELKDEGTLENLVHKTFPNQSVPPEGAIIP